MPRSNEPASLLVIAAHIFLLTSVSLALPLFDVLSDSPAFFVAQGSRIEDVVAFVAITCLLAPLLLLVCVGVARATNVRAGTWLARFIVCFLAALYLLRVANALAAPQPILAVGGTALASLVFGWLYVRQSAIRLFLTVLSPAGLAIPALFLLQSSVEALGPPPDPRLPTNVLEVERRPPIVFVVFDELPLLSLLGADGEIDGSRFPNFARLAGMSTWFRATSTVSDSTPSAITAIATGNYVKEGNMAVWGHHRQSLFTMLRGSYAFNTWEIDTRLVPPALQGREAAAATYGFSQRMFLLLVDASVIYAHLVLPVELRDRLPPIDGAWKNLADVEPPGVLRNQKGWQRELFSTDRGRVVRDFIASIDADGPPTLHFLHTILPHTPWIYFPSGRQHGPIRIKAVGIAQNANALVTWEKGPESRMRRWHQRHLLQTAYADALLGELLDHLAREEMLDDALVVVTSDHGRAFIVGDEHRVPSGPNQAEVLFVPLFIKSPGDRGPRTSDITAQIIDIVPSIADLLGGEMPWKVDGTSLFGDAPRPTDRMLYSLKTKRLLYRDKKARARLDQAVTRNTNRFSLDQPGYGLYRFGPFLHAIGAPTSDLIFVDAAFTAELERSSRTFDIASDARELPAQIVGRVVPASLAGHGRSVAISVNGTIAAVAELEAGDGRFEAILPESALRDGHNELTIHLIDHYRGSNTIDRRRFVLAGPAQISDGESR